MEINYPWTIRTMDLAKSKLSLLSSDKIKFQIINDKIYFNNIYKLSYFITKFFSNLMKNKQKFCIIKKI